MYIYHGAKMGRKKSLINSEILALIDSDLSNIKDSDTVIKLKALKAASMHNEAEVASIFNVSRSTIERWLSSYKKYGIEGLRPKSRGHNPSKLSPEQKELIKQWIVNQTDSNGHPVHWTLKRLIQEIILVFNIEITKTPLWLTLHSMNLTVKTPRPRHYKSDKAKQSEFKKNSGPNK
jgi:transposase